MFSELSFSLFTHQYLAHYVRSDKEHNKLNGRRHGLYERRHENGQLWIRCSYQNGRRHGRCQIWFNDGQLWELCTYINGERHGPYEQRHNNGKPWLRCIYIKNHGLHGKIWYVNGRLRYIA